MMPTRLIRDGYLYSEAYASVDDAAKLCWHHILSLADDFGCISLAPSFVRRQLFFNAPSDVAIAKILDQLRAADLIRIYEHNDTRFAFIPRYRQRIQRMTLKHPRPPSDLIGDDDWIVEKFKSHAIKDLTKNPTATQQLPNTVPNTVANTVANVPDVDVDVDEKHSFNKTVLKQRPEVDFSLKPETASTDASPSGFANKTRKSVLSKGEKNEPRGTRLPETWTPGEIGLAYCRTKRPDVNPQDAFEQFQNYWTAKAGKDARKADWMKTWRNWVMNQKSGTHKAPINPFRIADDLGLPDEEPQQLRGTK